MSYSVVFAVPVALRDLNKKLEGLVDEVVVLELPVMFMGAIGAYYEKFDQVEDEEVIKLLKC